MMLECSFNVKPNENSDSTFGIFDCTSARNLILHVKLCEITILVEALRCSKSRRVPLCCKEDLLVSKSVTSSEFSWNWYLKIYPHLASCMRLVSQVTVAFSFQGFSLGSRASGDRSPRRTKVCHFFETCESSLLVQLLFEYQVASKGSVIIIPNAWVVPALLKRRNFTMIGFGKTRGPSTKNEFALWSV